MNNEEKILEMLAVLTETVSKQGEQLAKQGEQLAEMQKTLTRVAITQENIVLPRLETLAEGHKHLLETLAPKARVEKLEDEVSTIKSVLISHSERLAALEKAQ